MSKEEFPIAYLKHMRDAGKAIMNYTSNHSEEDFYDSEWDQVAAIRNLEIIGEAATNISTEFRNKHTEIQWRDIIDFRNVVIHQYMKVDNEIIWNVMKNDVPSLLQAVEKVLEDLE